MIIDEASQVDIVAGLLTFACAKNVVVVGDLKQLPNVVPEGFKNQTNEIFPKYNISDGYRCAGESLLSSMLKMYPEAAKILLKEHYRCNPRRKSICKTSMGTYRFYTIQ